MTMGTGGAASGASGSPGTGGPGGSIVLTTGGGGNGTANNSSGGAGGALVLNTGSGGSPNGTGFVGNPGAINIQQNGTNVFGVVGNGGLTINAGSPTASTTVQGGQSQNTNSALGGVSVQGASETGSGGSSSVGGNAFVAGGTNAATNTSSVAGSVGTYAGASTGASPNTGHQGLRISAIALAKGTTSNQWNLQCSQSTPEQTQDCPANPTNILGVAATVGTVAVTVIDQGDSPINAATAVSAGHTVCAGGTPGKVTDSGGTSPCASGFTVGYVTHTSGNYTLPDGTSVSASSTLPIVHLSFGGPTSTTVNGQTCVPGSVCSVNPGAAQYSVAVNGASGSALQGVPCAAGQVLQGASTNPTCTATPTLGSGGTLGSITMGNATSGTLTIEPTTGALGAGAIQYVPVPPSASPGTLTQTIAAGTAALGTSSISSGACAAVVTSSATNVATTDVIKAGFNSDPTGTVGYSPSSGGMLTIIAFPTSNNVNFKVCNNTGSSITPGSITLNWTVQR
jgi:hypothetical protein